MRYINGDKKHVFLECALDEWNIRKSEKPWIVIAGHVYTPGVASKMAYYADQINERIESSRGRRESGNFLTHVSLHESEREKSAVLIDGRGGVALFGPESESKDLNQRLRTISKDPNYLYTFGSDPRVFAEAIKKYYYVVHHIDLTELDDIISGEETLDNLKEEIDSTCLDEIGSGDVISSVISMDTGDDFDEDDEDDDEEDD
jgi:hypothetical protein